jgi:hypothetical protein
MKKSRKDIGKPKGIRKKSALEAPEEDEESEECKKTSSGGNLNRIRYKMNQHKREESEPKKRRVYEATSTEILEAGSTDIKTSRDKKIATEEKKHAERNTHQPSKHDEMFGEQPKVT